MDRLDIGLKLLEELAAISLVHPFSQLTYAEAVSGDAGLLLGLLGFKVLMTGQRDVCTWRQFPSFWDADTIVVEIKTNRPTNRQS